MPKQLTRCCQVVMLYACLFITTTLLAQDKKNDRWYVQPTTNPGLSTNAKRDGGIFTQNGQEIGCGNDDLHQRKMASDPNYRRSYEHTQETIYQIVKQQLEEERQQQNSDKSKPKRGASDNTANRRITSPCITGGNSNVVTIPVVVHVMHLPGTPVGTNENISDATIQAGIQHLNDAFRDVGVYAPGPLFTNAGITDADMEIEFCLAVRDPSGNATTGINRVATTYSNLFSDDAAPGGTQDDALKALSFWNSNLYMNVWLVNEICTASPGTGCGVAGYAYLASAHGQTYDGVVNEARWWGSSTDNSKVHIHEVGHYLDLSHTFNDHNNDGSSCENNNCLTEGDFVCDTPPDAGTTAVNCGASGTANTCSTDADDVSANNPFTSNVQDIYEDYMDYGFQSCQNTFTPGQKIRARAALFGIRGSLLTSLGCTPVVAVEANLSAVVFPNGSVCTTTFAPIITLTNNGTSNITSAVINFQIDGGATVTFTWTGTLAAGTSTNVTLPNGSFSGTGTHNIYFTLGNINGSPDSYADNNEWCATFAYNPISTFPYCENFTTGAPNWSAVNPDNSVTWNKTYNNSGAGASCANGTTAFFNAYNYSTTGQDDYLVSPLIDLSSVGGMILNFDVAHRFYGSPYIERLRVEISTDCGTTYTPTTYDKQGATLATVGTGSVEYFPTTGCSDWRNETVNLSTYAGSSILIRFRVTNGYGNNLFLDNICLTALNCDAPTNATLASPTPNSLTASWTAPAATPDGYIVQYSSNGGTNWNTASASAHPWINEIHYDNNSTDADEGFEIAGAAGKNLACYKMYRLNGNAPTAAVTYTSAGTSNPIALSGTIDDEGNGFGAVWFGQPLDALQNGANDGLALVYEADATCNCPGTTTLVQLLSYEGSYTVSAATTPAILAGQVATDIGVSESSTSTVGNSLQISGCGDTYSDFVWNASATNTRGTLNTNQAIYSTTSTSLAMNGLAPCTAYQMRVKSYCCTLGLATAAATTATTTSTAEDPALNAGTLSVASGSATTCQGSGTVTVAASGTAVGCIGATQYQYVLINSSNTIVAGPQTSTTFSLSSLAVGSYTIYGFIYKASTDYNAAATTLAALDNGGCYDATDSGIAVTVNPIPAQPTAITGNATPCPSQTGVTYSITAVANATGYTWSVPSGYTITAGQNTTTATITIGTVAGNICVTANNACGSSPQTCIAISFVDTDSDGTADCIDACPNDPLKIAVGQCGCGVADTDTDADGTANCNDACPNDPNKIAAGVCGCGVADTDTDADGTADCNDACPNDPNKIAAGVCGCGVADTDTDGDGTADCNDACPNDPNKIAAGICGCGVADTDTDGDGTANCLDLCPNDPNKIAAGTCGCGVADTDTDSDGTANCLDLCPNDPNKIAAGVCGCGVADTDTDADGTANCLDLCPNDPNKIAAGTCGCGVADTDTDADGTADCLDLCPNDPNKIAAGICGCGVADTDTDADGTADCNDACPNDPAKIAAGICGCGVADTDTDGDGTANCLDLCPNDPSKIAVGQCGCGVADTDTDADGTADCNDACPNDPLKIAAGACGCGVAEGTCSDCAGVAGGTAFIDGCGVCAGGTTGITPNPDADSDGTPDCNDACPNDPAKIAAGICGCGIADTDTDADGTADCNDACPNDPNKIATGICGCGVADTDTDGDGTADCSDACPNDPNKIATGICGCGVADTDTDADGTADCNDACPNDPAKTAAGVCGCGVADTDTDADGTADCNDACPTDPNKIAAGICGCGVADTDTDADGTADCLDLCPNDPNKIAAGVCGCGVADTDTDADGTADCNDACPNDPAKTVAGVCGCGVADTDTDADGTADCNDACPNDPNKIAAGVCGCGVADTDTDADGTADCNDACPNDPAKTAAGICGCGVADTDTDADGTADCNDACPNDPAKTAAGICGCGVADTDTDADGTADCNDACPNDPAKIAAGICGCGTVDTDTDGDGTADCNDACPNDPAKIAVGQCGCGVADTDTDADGTADCNDACPNDPLKITAGACGCGVAEGTCSDCAGVAGGTAFTDACGICAGGTTGIAPNPDADGDGTLDCNDACPNDPNKIAAGICGCGTVDTDTDGDGTANCLDLCPNDPNKIAAGVCGCGVADTDTDADGTADCNDACPNDPAKTAAGICGCGVADTDTDADGTADCNDACPNDPAKIAAGVCGCGVADTDTDADGTADCNDACPNDPAKTAAGICGCGVADTDTDADGTADCNDACPNDPNKIAAGVCGCGVADTDTDADGTANCLDLCPNDPNKIAAGACGCGVADTDTDADGTADCNDACPNDPLKILAGACGCGVAEGTCSDCAGVAGGTAFIDACGICAGGTTGIAPNPDADGDGTLDCNDACPNDPNKIAAGICGCGTVDTDTDGDGTANCLDLCPNDPNKIAAGACGCGVADTDTDADGTADCLDLCPNDPNKIAAGICGCGVADTDTDADGTADCLDLCPNDPNKIAAGICGCGVADTDTDADGTADCNDACPNDPAKTAAGICGCGVADTDTDADGTADCNDACPNDPAKIAAGICGCGVVDTDTDGDGTADCNDACPNDPAKIAAGQCGCGVADTDTDADGTANCNDACPNDPLKITAGACGCGVAEGTCSDCAGVAGGTAFIDACGICAGGTTGIAPNPDADGDGTLDCNDACPNDPNKIAAGICGCGTVDTDTDGDGTANCLDLCPNDPNKIAAGTCGCGVADTDTDADGTADCNDACPNDPAKTVAGICGCGVADTDTDADGTADCNDACPNDPAKIAAGVCGCGVADTDTDADGTADCNDACPNDPAKTAAGICGCGVADTDTDADGTADCNDACPNDPNKIAAGICGCGTVDTDTDGDGTANCLDLCPNDPNKTAAGQCGCGVADTDTDGDGVANCNDNCDNAANANQADNDNDGLGNACDICPNHIGNDADGDGVCGDIDCNDNDPTVTLVCCAANAGTISTNNGLCPGDLITAQASGFTSGTVSGITYNFYYVLVNTSTNQVVAVSPANAGTSYTFAGFTSAGNYAVYGYSVKVLPSPVGGVVPIVGTLLSSLSDNSVSPNCRDLSSAANVAVPAAFNAIGGVANTNEGSGGTGSFAYNTHVITVTGGSLPYNFNWNNSGYVRYDIQYTETGCTITLYYADNATWGLTITDSNACGHSSLVFNNAPIVNAILDIDNYVISSANATVGGAIDISVSGGNCSGNYSYQWSGPNGFAATTQDINNLASGWYSVTVTCGTQTTIGWYWVPRARRGRSKTSNISPLTAAPNPFSTETTLLFSLEETDMATLQIFAADGRLVAELFNEQVQADVEYSATLSNHHLQMGVYIARLTTAKGAHYEQKLLLIK